MTVYLDNSATTAVCPEAAEKMMEIMTAGYGNPSSTHHMGRQAKKELESARSSVAGAVGCAPEEIYFTSGGTEADNIAIFGACQRQRHFGNHIITTAYEHDAVIKPFEYLKDQGWDVTFIRPGKDGKISVDDFKNALRPDTVFASVMAVNNEVGAVNDIAAMSRALKEACPDAFFHTDAVQALGKIDIRPKNTGADLMTVSAHKIHGPKGVGALYMKTGTKIIPPTKGGGQEENIRPGTEGMPAICGFGVAADIAKREMETSKAHFKTLRDTLVKEMCQGIDGVVVIGGGADHILSVSIPGFRSEVLLNYLDSKGICVSKGSACKRGARSHVLAAMGIDPKVIDGALRISFSRYNTLEEIHYTAEAFIEASKKLIRVK